MAYATHNNHVTLADDSTTPAMGISSIKISFGGKVVGIHNVVSRYWCVTYVLQYTHIVSQFLRLVSSERHNVAVETIGSERNHLHVI